MASVGLISIAEYARRRGVSHEAVRKAVKAGRITLIDGKIDPDVADIQWERNTRKVIGRGHVAPGPAQSVGDGAAQAADAARGSEGALGMPAYDYEASRAKREHHEAGLAALKERERLGELVEISRVRMATAELMRIVVDGLERIPDRIAVQVHTGMAHADIHALIEQEVRAICQDLAAGVEAFPRKLKSAGQ
ncbi:MAG: hypothetical protein M0T84_00225 [Betaproteobacteria bacterium]|nr:hypothetical protein [Betaproteobacteria bacterium]